MKSRKISVMTVQGFPASSEEYPVGIPSRHGVRPKTLVKQSSFDLSGMHHRKLSVLPVPTQRHDRRRSAVNPPSSENPTATLQLIKQKYSSSFDTSEFHRQQRALQNAHQQFFESHFNGKEVTTTVVSHSYPRSKKLYGPSLEASSEFKKKLKTKVEEIIDELYEKISKINQTATVELKVRTEECLLHASNPSSFPASSTSSSSGVEDGSASPNQNHKNLNSPANPIRNFCLTTFKIMLLVNETYSLLKSLLSNSSSSSGGTILSEAFRNHDFAKDISVSYFGLDWQNVQNLIISLENKARALKGSRKGSVEHHHFYQHYYSHHHLKDDSISSQSSSGNPRLSVQKVAVSVCKDLRKLRDDVMSHTEAVLRGRLSPANTKFISEEQNRFRAYNVINTLLGHRPVERSGSFSEKFLSLFGHKNKRHRNSSGTSKAPSIEGGEEKHWHEWLEAIFAQGELIKKIQEI